MNHTEAYFTGPDQAKLFYQSWLPDDPPRAIIVIEHGLAEHGGRYMNVVNQLVPAGFGVYALDQYGHGRSDGARVFVPCFDVYIDILKIFHDLVRAKHPDEKIFLYGHSMGSLIVANYLIDYQQELAGAILSGIFTKVPDNITPMTVMMGKVFSSVLPKLGVTKIDSAGVSRDQEVVMAYDNDPLVYRGKVTARLGAETLQGFARVAEEQHKIRLPILLLQGTEDLLVNPIGAQELYDSISSEDKTLEYYEGYYHEVCNDIGKEQVLADMQAWLEDHL
jgi:alpha-beta hydrolase superfamily lysophospholipase